MFLYGLSLKTFINKPNEFYICIHFWKMKILPVTSFLYPSGAVLIMPAIIPRLYAKETVACDKCRMKRLPKAHELSLYETHRDSTEEQPVTVEPGSLENGISIVHKQISKYFSAVEVFCSQAIEICNTGVAHSKNTYDYLRQEENFTPRVLTIAAGGLTGMLIAARGGWFKKIIYSSTGVGAVASACYPKEAKDYIQQGYCMVSNKTNKILKEHAGYDIEKITTDAKDKVGSFKSTLGFQNITNSLKEMFGKIYPVEKMTQNKNNHVKKLEDHGQSNPKDADLYTTRS